MQTARRTSPTHEQAMSAITGNGATLQQTRWWETAYTTVNWDYPPSPAAYHNALLSRGASHSRFLRIAHLSTRERSSTPTPSSPLVSLSPTSTLSPLDTSTPAHLASTAPLTPTGSPRKQAIHLPPIPPYLLSRPCVNVRPRSANPLSHTLKRRKPQWPKPPHYHASLLRSPLSRRKGFFRAVLPPNKAVDFFRWDILLGAGVSFSALRQERDRTRTSDEDACASLHVAEFVLEPYEAAAGFSGWHGLGLDVSRRVERNFDDDIDDECYWTEGAEVCRPGLEHDGAGKCRSSDLQLEIDEATVDEGRASWARAAEELVGPPGLALRWVIEDGKSGKVTMPFDPARKDSADSRAPPSISLSREEVRCNPDFDFSPFSPSRPTSVSDEKRQSPPSSSTAFVPGSASSFKRELKTDSPSVWWYGPSPHRGPPPTPHLPSLRFPPPPHVQYGPPSLQFSPYFPGSRVTPAQGHGYWYGTQPTGELTLFSYPCRTFLPFILPLTSVTRGNVHRLFFSPKSILLRILSRYSLYDADCLLRCALSGAPSSVNHDPNLAKPLPPHSHIFAAPVTPTSVHRSQSPRHPTKPSLGRDEYGPGHDCDKETETDHDYESTTTTTDSDLPPHTPIGAATTSHCIEALQVHGDNEVEVHGIEIDTEHAAASVTFGLSDPTTPVKLLGRFASPSASSGSPDSNRAGYEPSKATVVFPSLNGSFRQGSSSRMSVSLSSQGMSTQTTPARIVTPASSSSLSSTKKMTLLGLGDEDNSNTQLRSGGLETSASVLSDNPAFMLSLCSPPPTSPGSGLRKDSQGFWEPVTPISPCSTSTSSSVPLSPSEGKTRSRPATEWIGEKKGEGSDSPEAASPQFTLSAKSRSLSPGSRHVTSAGSTRSSSSRPASFSSPMSTPASTSMFGGSYPPSPSPPNNSSLVPPNTTLLPAFLATATVKRKKASRTREIVDRLRSTSIDAGKGGVELDSLGWPASPSAGGELDGKTPSGADESHIAGGQPSPPPPKSSSDSPPWLGSDLGKNHGQAPGSKSSDSSSSGSRRKSNGATAGSEAPFPLATSRTTGNPNITPFPILTVSQTSASNFTMTHQRQTGVTTTTPSKGPDGSKMNAVVATSPNGRSPGSQPVAPNGGTSPSTHSSHHSLPSPSHPIVHPQPVLGPPPPMLAVSAYPHPMYVPLTQYRLAPPLQIQQGQGTWLAIYPGCPPHLPVHPLPTQSHVPPITGVSGMRHVSW